MEKFLSFVPFLLVAKSKMDLDCNPSPEGLSPNNGRPASVKLNTQRIIEGVIIAAIAGAVSGYISVARLEVKVDNLSSEIKAVETRICTENSRQEKRIDDNLTRIERLADIVGKQRSK